MAQNDDLNQRIAAGEIPPIPGTAPSTVGAATPAVNAAVPQTPAAPQYQPAPQQYAPQAPQYVPQPAAPQAPATPQYVPQPAAPQYQLAPQQFVPAASALPQQLPDGAPVRRLPANRNFWLYLIFTLVTFGIYPLIVVAKIGEEVNVIASRHDGRRTMNYILVALILGPLTVNIYTLVWWHGTSDRIGDELTRRGHSRMLSSSDFWLWGVLGIFIVVGPYIYLWKLLKAVNTLNADYNVRG